MTDTLCTALLRYSEFDTNIMVKVWKRLNEVTR